MVWLAQLVFVALTIGLVIAARRGSHRLPAGWWAPLSAALCAAWTAALAFLLSYVLAELGEFRVVARDTLVTAAFCAAVAWPTTLVPMRARAPATAVIGLMLVTLAWADLLHSRFFGSFLPLWSLLAAGQTWEVRDSIGEVIRAADASLLLLVAAAAALSTWPRPPPTAWRPRLALLIAISLVTAVATMPAWRALERYLASRDSWHVFTTEYWVAGVGFVGGHIYDLAHTWRERRSFRCEDAAPVAALAASLRQRRPLPAAGDQLFAAARGANVLVIQLEATQQWLLGARVRGEAVTPFLNRLRTESLDFPFIFAQTAGGSTSDSEYLVLNSLLPLAKGAVAFRRPSNQFVTVPQRLAAAGYTTAAAHAGARGFWNRATLFPRYGIDTLWFGDDLGATTRDGLGDGAFFTRVLPHLESLPRPFFALLITLSGHHPYTRRDGPVELPLGELAGSLLGRYLQVQHYVDGALADLFAGLAEAGRLDDTLIVVYGDHDSRVTVKPTDRARFATELHTDGLDFELLATRDPRLRRVPLLIRLPGGHNARQVDTVGGQLDIGPTLLHLLGIPPAPVFLGRSLLSPDAGFAALVDGSTYGDGLACVGPRRQSACTGCTDFPPAPNEPANDEAACASLRARAAELLRLSWRITEGNLAARLDDELSRQVQHTNQGEDHDEMEVVGEGVPGEEEE